MRAGSQTASVTVADESLDGAGCTVRVRTPVTEVASEGWVYQA